MYEQSNFFYSPSLFLLVFLSLSRFSRRHKAKLRKISPNKSSQFGFLMDVSKTMLQNCGDGNRCRLRSQNSALKRDDLKILMAR